MLADEVTRLIERLGSEALAWLLGTDTVTVRSWGLGLTDPPGEAAAVVQLLSRIVEAVGQQEHGTFALASALAQPSPEGLTMGAELRQAAGGSLAAPESGDPVARPLLQLAAQLAGVHLLRPDPELRPFVGVAGMAAGDAHPLAAETARAAAASLPLDRWTTEGLILMRSSGSGGSFTTSLLAAHLLTDAASRWLFHPGWPALDPFFHSVVETVAAFRRVAAGRTASVPALIGIAGIQFPQERPATLPWGVLRSLRPHELERLPDPAVETVLEARVPFRAFVMEADSMTFPSEIRDSFLLRLRLARDTAFAILLARTHLPRVATTPAFYLVTDPVQGVPHASHSAVEPTTPIEISSADVGEIETWARAYNDHHHRSLDVAVRRAVGATGRLDTSDAFIDAVIGWDNLFGSAAGESQLRIAASFARLLEVDASSRRVMAQQVKSDYDLRSRLVHGDLSELPSEEVAAAPARALDLLLRALRTLYTERCDLIAINSGQRSQALLLGGQQRTSDK